MAPGLGAPAPGEYSGLRAGAGAAALVVFFEGLLIGGVGISWWCWDSAGTMKYHTRPLAIGSGGS
jgi:hypothetical protein